jgi:hypothetical protein
VINLIQTPAVSERKITVAIEVVRRSVKSVSLLM